MGLPDEFIEHGKPAELYQIVGLDVNSIAAKIVEFSGK
jgi:deoxyxylulose-5-phosphate synthase